MRVVFSRPARSELEDAQRYYELLRPGLGAEFRVEIQQAARRISEHPHAWSVELRDVRKCLLHRFPYKILYSVESSHILILAIGHQHRRPDYWIERGVR